MEFADSSSHPFEHPICLELASRFWRNIICSLARADMILKPTWPVLWQQCEVFRNVHEFKPPAEYVPRDDLGSVKRTLDAYIAAYRCDAVEFEINWMTRYSPEFRLLPPKRGKYCRRQLLAVLRALRYNDFFRSLCFRDVDLSILWNWCDNGSRTTRVGYLSRGGTSKRPCLGMLVSDANNPRFAPCR
jgi:hypothetical protein